MFNILVVYVFVLKCDCLFFRGGGEVYLWVEYRLRLRKFY